MLVDRFGYKKTMVIGLITMAAGAGGFVPASIVASFPVFLSALIILAAGMTIVQVSINPYVTVIGPAATASSRLNLAQAFNSVGTFIAPFLGAYVILRHVAKQLQPAQLHIVLWTAEIHKTVPNQICLHPRRTHDAVQVAPQHAGRELHHCVAEVDDGTAGHRLHVDPLFGSGQEYLQAADSVEQDR